MLSKIKRFIHGSDDGNGYQEISEKKTTKIGYFLLIVMFIFLVGVGQTVFDDLNSIVPRPTSPSSCSNISVQSLVGYSTHYTTQNEQVSRCRFTEIDSEFGLDTKYKAIFSVLKQISDLNNSTQQYESSIRKYENDITSSERTYNLSLQEKMADEEVLYDKANLQNTISQNRVRISNSQRQISSNKAQVNTLVSSISSQVNDLHNAYLKAYDQYQNDRAWYKFKQFGLALLFVVPFFILSTRWYLKAKKKDSPYTIISTSVMAASAILMLQVILMFLYDVLPMGWIARIFEIFLTVPILRFVIYYGGIALVVAVFGGVVYFIQARVYNPKRVARRRLKQGECPRCSYTIHRDDIFCPSCSQQIRKDCPVCGHKRSVHLDYCDFCGAKDNGEVVDFVE